MTTPDLNTYFFNLSTIVRRRRNSIDALIAPNGQWLEGRESTGAHFQTLFSLSQPEFPAALHDLLSPLITLEDNLDLCCYPTEEEIWRTV